MAAPGASPGQRPAPRLCAGGVTSFFLRALLNAHKYRHRTSRFSRGRHQGGFFCFWGSGTPFAMRKDIGEGIRAGVTGTPGFSIDGWLLSDAQPLERFARMIEEELIWAR